MGTNYYLVRETKPACPTCGHQEIAERLHIGKSSRGWCFSLQVDPARNIMTLEDWVLRWSQPGTIIEDEYGRATGVEEMMDCIQNRKLDTPWEESFKETRWCRDEEEFHRMNHSERGPNNLLRHRVDGVHCLGHGPGTWDYIAGDFS